MKYSSLSCFSFIFEEMNLLTTVKLFSSSLFESTSHHIFCQFAVAYSFSARFIFWSFDWVDNMSVNAATALIGWRTSSGSWHNYCVSLWKRWEPRVPRFWIEVNVLRGGWKLAVLRLHHGATLQSAVEAIVEPLCKIVFYSIICWRDYI